MIEFNDIGSIASVLGVFLGIGSIAYAYFIKREVHKISEKQKDNAQGPYKVNTNKNTDEIHRHFKEIIRITKNTDVESDDLEESVNHSNINAELYSYCQAERANMQNLLEKSTRELGSWSDLDKNVRLELERVIEDFRWLINDFFQVNRDEEMQMRVWIENHSKLTSKKHDIEQILRSNKEILS